MKPLIVVCGCESSGTRLVTRAVQQATGFSLRPLTKMWEGEIIKPGNIVGAVSRKSMPHNVIGPSRKIFDPLTMYNTAKAAGWQPHFLFTVRDQTICFHSKMKNHTRNNQQLTLKEMALTKSLLLECMEHIPAWDVVSFEALVQFGPRYLALLLAKRGFRTSPIGEEIRDENAKYWRK